MKALITTVGDNPWNDVFAAHFHDLAARDRIGKHELTDDAAAADVILFVDMQQHESDWSMKGLRTHPLSARFGAKVMVFDERDRPNCVFPGLFVSMPASGFDAARQRAFSYVYLKNDLMQPDVGEPDLLFSFLGANTHPVRDELLKLTHPRAVVEDTSKVSFFRNDDSEEFQAQLRGQKERYREVAARSKFVLCPRGWGTSSFRLYETLAAGRVPVIVSDEWVPTQGDWDACSVRVAQSEVAQIPALLEAREAQWPAMASAARQMWDEWHAPDVLFSRLMDECQWLLENGELGVKPKLFLDADFRAQGLKYARKKLRQLRART